MRFKVGDKIKIPLWYKNDALEQVTVTDIIEASNQMCYKNEHMAGCCTMEEGFAIHA